MGITIKAFLLFFIFISTLALVNTASAGITITDAEAIYEANLSSVSVPTSPEPRETIFTFNEEALLEQALSSVSIPTQPIPIKEIFIINEDAAFDTSLFAVSIPTERSPIKKIFSHLEEAKAYEDLIFPIKLINDATSPIITNVTVTNITNNSVTIKWDTDEIADSVVKYGKASGIYTETERNPLFVRNHTIALAKLSSGTKYYFVVSSMDRSGNSAISSECRFTTTGMINQPPIASFTYTPENPVANQTITFNASDSYDLDGTIISYEWDFGDGTNGTGEIVEHSYSSAGNYTVNLTLTDDSNSEKYTGIIIPVRTRLLSKPINMDAVEGVYPLDHAAKDNLFNMKKDSI